MSTSSQAGEAKRFANDASGLEELVAFCREHGAELVVMEATGGYERTAFALLWGLGLPCGLANAPSVRRFAEAMGHLEKADSIDAAMIARYGQVKRLQPTPLQSPAAQRLKALVARLRQVTADITINKQRRSAASDQETLASLDETLAFLKHQSRELEARLVPAKEGIASLIDDDPLWERLGRAFREIKGVASRTVARLMAELPEIGTLSNKAIAKLGGHEGPRSNLFLAAGIAAKYHQHLAAFHQRLSQAGKPKMVIRIALARKLLVILNAKARDARNERKCSLTPKIVAHPGPFPKGEGADAVAG